MMTFILPWNVLVPDNAKTGVFRGKVILTSRYRTAKAKASTMLRIQARTPREWNQPCSLVARIFFPDARKRDAGNLRKLVTDACQAAGIVTDDAT
jgi:Holliday junction resolvase RusA-like endonuclease